MSMDLELTQSNVKLLKNYNEGNRSAEDDIITREFILAFNEL